MATITGTERRYFTIMTNIGLALVENAIRTGKKVNITSFAVGDGNGSYYVPDANMTVLKNEVWRGGIAKYEKDSANANGFIVSAYIPADVGGFTIREMACFDSDGNMVALANSPDLPKVVITEGAVDDMYVALTMIVTNAEAVNFTVNPAAIVALKEEMEQGDENMLKAAKTYTDESEERIRMDFAGVAQETTLQQVQETSTEVLNMLREKTMKRYGIRINKNEPDPAARIEYIYDAQGMKPAKMNYVTGQFDYGDWANVWFVRDNYPVMLKFSGEEDYRLDPNDHTKKLTGEASDITNTAYDGNAMVAIPLVWIARWEEGNYEYISVCQSQYDDSYRADAHTKEDGSVADKIYMAMYRGSLVDTKLRSLSGQQPMYSKTAQQEIDYAKANGVLWDIDTYSRYNLIADLMTIMAKTENSQGAFGNGNLNYQEDLSPTYGVMQTGTLNASGQFWGANDNIHQMKAFYIEAVYADQWRRVRGLIYDHGVIKVKPTAPYNLTGEGYVNTGIHLLDASGAAKAGTA